MSVFLDVKKILIPDTANIIQMLGEAWHLICETKSCAGLV
jgi:hypothetical protein